MPGENSTVLAAETPACDSLADNGSKNTNRLDKLESALASATAIVYRLSSVIEYDDEGQCTEVVVYGAANKCCQAAFPHNLESRRQLYARAYVAVGRQPDDGLIERHLVKAGPNGGLAAGFERFAEHA